MIGKARTYRCLSARTFGEGAYALRAVQPGDVEPIRLWRNAQLDVLRQARPISPEDQQAYFNEWMFPDYDRQNPRNILLTYLESDTPIGYGGLVHIEWEHARAEISFLLEPQLARDPARYHGLFETFLRLIRQVAFDDLKLHRLFTETYAFRDEHIATLERSGFFREGTLRDHVIVNDEPMDSIIHGCLNPTRQVVV